MYLLLKYISINFLQAVTAKVKVIEQEGFFVLFTMAPCYTQSFRVPPLRLDFSCQN